MPSFISKINEFLTTVKLTDKLFFTQNLSLMSRSGIPLSQALESLVKQTENKKFKAILSDLVLHIQKGEPFSEQLKAYPKVFSEIFVNMVHAGEESGKLEEILKTLTNQLRNEHELRSKVKGAVAYPTVVLIAMLGITTGLVVFIVPKLAAMFEGAGIKLPLPTRILLGLSAFAGHYSYILLAIIIFVVIVFIKFKKTHTGKLIFHLAILKAPVVGTLAKKINIARFSRSLASLLKTDIPIVKSFDIASKTLNNIYYQEALVKIGEQLKSGTSIGENLSIYSHLFPPTITQMVSVGEETGKLDEILEQIALFYEEDLDSTLKNLPALLEPILILLLGATVGGVAIAIMMPIFSLSQTAGG